MAPEYKLYSIRTKIIRLSSKVQSAGIVTIDASQSTGFGDDVLEVNAFQFSSRTDLIFIGSDDKDVNVKFTGGSGDDTLTTGKITEDGSDTLTGGLGLDTFNIIASDEPAEITDLGTGGSDALVVTSSAKGVVATVKENYSSPSLTNNTKNFSDVVLNAESGVDIDMFFARGTAGYKINGGAAASTLQGSSFNDSITGNSSHDSLVGNDGNDTINGNGGNDTIRAGEGNDSIQFASAIAVDGISLDGGDGTDTIDVVNATSAWTGEFDFDDISGIGTISSSGAGASGAAPAVTISDIAETTSQVITIDGSSHTAHATADFDVLNSANSSTTTFSITGGDGADSLGGSNGADTISGGAAVDTITGGLGGDSLVGGAGNDVFVMGAGSTVTNAGAVTSGSTDISSGLDIITAALGDTFNFASFDNVTIGNGAVADGTTLHNGTANQVNLVSGSYNTTSGVFTTGAYSADNNDTLLQVAGGASTTTINNFLLLDSGAITDINFASEVGTLR